MDPFVSEGQVESLVYQLSDLPKLKRSTTCDWHDLHTPVNHTLLATLEIILQAQSVTLKRPDSCSKRLNGGNKEILQDMIKSQMADSRLNSYKRSRALGVFTPEMLHTVSHHTS